MAGFTEYVPFVPGLLAFDGFAVVAFVLATERLLHEAVAVLQEVSADLATCA